MGEAVGSSVSVNFGTPADTVDIGASLAINEKGSFPHCGFIVAVHQSKTAGWYQVFWSDVLNTVENHRKKLPYRKHGGSCLAQRNFYD